jgi:hypothetical protein
MVEIDRDHQPICVASHIEDNRVTGDDVRRRVKPFGVVLDHLDYERAAASIPA